MNFPFVPNVKFFIFRCPKIWTYYSLIIMCFNIRTSKNINFSFGTNGKLKVLGVPILNYFRVAYTFCWVSKKKFNLPSKNFNLPSKNFQLAQQKFSTCPAKNLTCCRQQDNGFVRPCSEVPKGIQKICIFRQTIYGSVKIRCS